MANTKKKKKKERELSHPTAVTQYNRDEKKRKQNQTAPKIFVKPLAAIEDLVNSLAPP